MTDIAIRIDKLSKKYQLGAVQERHNTLRDAMVATLKRPAMRLARGSSAQRSSSSDTLWALRDVSLEVKSGEVLGIIGRNGAGKSTLLKILSRITEPTSGYAEIHGRIGSLLEVGTGFHPELTGRENIYLNGAILGMRKWEINRQFDDIVAFAEIERFLDTPVKRYSSGMYVRLAFAVAAHLDPEVLLVDEVLAVGDVSFQDKCLGKMGEVAKQGRTVIFVSHNMEAVDKLTSRSIWLNAGSVRLDGQTQIVVKEYLDAAHTAINDISDSRVSSIPDSTSVCDLWVENGLESRTTIVRQGEPFRIMLQFDSQIVSPVDAAIVVENGKQQPLFATHLSDLSAPAVGRRIHTYAVRIDNPPLRRGRYLVSIALFSPDQRLFYDVIYHFPLFEVAGVSDPEFPNDIRWGDLYFPIEWRPDSKC